MIDANSAIGAIKRMIIAMIENGVLKARYEESSSSISFYTYSDAPLLTLRLSNHPPKFNNTAEHTPDASNRENVGIDFFVPVRNAKGKFKKQKTDKRVNVMPDNIPHPFKMHNYEYYSDMMCNNDVLVIFKAIKNFLMGGQFIDPFANTPKAAHVTGGWCRFRIQKPHRKDIVRKSEIVDRRGREGGWENASRAEINFYKRYGMGDSIIRKGTIIENNQIQKENMKQTIRLNESQLRDIISESVKRVLMENTQPSQRVKAGNQQYAREEQLQNDMQKIPQYYQELVNNGETYVSWADEYFDEWLIKNHPELNYDVKPCADYMERTKFFLVMKEATADPRWWQKDGVFPDMKGNYYRKPKQQKEGDDTCNGNKSGQSVRVSEAQLHQIVKESVEQVLSEAYSDAQYAHLAGQANGALNSFGGKLKGMFNPKWKSRKERQMRQFANQATHDNPGYERSSTKGGDNNDGGNTYKMPEHNYTWSNGGQADYIANSFNPQNQESPFEMKRTQRYVTVDDPSNIFSKRSSRAMANDGDVYSRGETRDMSKKYADNNEWDKFDAIGKLRDSNSRLNRAFNKGKEARNGGTYGGYNGTPTYKNGTGTQSGAFKKLK